MLLPRAYDQAFFEQVVWNAGHGGGFQSGFSSGSFLGLHFSPLLLLPAAAELLWPDARVLSLFEAVGLGACAPAAFLLLRDLLPPGRRGTALAAAIALPLPFWAALQGAALSEFHPEVLALPAVMMATWAGLRGRVGLTAVFALVAITAKEDQSYPVLLAGLVVFSRGTSRRLGLGLAASAVVWGAVVVGLVMPALRDGAPSQLSGYYNWLGDPAPSRVAEALTSPQAWLVFAGMVVSAAGLPLLSPRWLLGVLPPFGASLLSAHDPQQHLGLHYALPLVFPLLLATASGGRRLLGLDLSFPAAVVALPALAVAVLLSPLLNLVGGPARGAFEAGGLARLQACTRALPTTAAVSADDSLAAPLAARHRLSPIVEATPPDWIALDRAGYQPRYVDAGRRSAVVAGLPGSGRRLNCDDGRFQLWGPVHE